MRRDKISIICLSNVKLLKEGSNSATMLDQADFIQMTPSFYALIATNPNSEIDNLITFTKSGYQQVIIRFEGSFFIGNENLRDQVYFTLSGPNGHIIEEFSSGSDQINIDFSLPSNADLGVYDILIDLGSPPLGDLQCCANYIYQISYSGLIASPHIQALGYDFGFIPDFGYVTLINRNIPLNFSFFGYPREFVFYHQPWGNDDVVTNVQIILPDGNNTLTPVKSMRNKVE